MGEEEGEGMDRAEAALAMSPLSSRPPVSPLLASFINAFFLEPTECSDRKRKAREIFRAQTCLKSSLYVQ